MYRDVTYTISKNLQVKMRGWLWLLFKNLQNFLSDLVLSRKINSEHTYTPNLQADLANRGQYTMTHKSLWDSHNFRHILYRLWLKIYLGVPLVLLKLESWFQRHKPGFEMLMYFEDSSIWTP